MSEAVWRGKYLEVRREGSWEYAARVGNLGATVMLAMTEAREVVLVEQHRIPLGCRTIELPAGLVGDHAPGESFVQTAARELVEETGFSAACWEDCGLFATSPGMTSETFRLFKATGLSRVSAGGGVGDEDIVVHVVALAGLGRLARGAARGGPRRGQPVGGVAGAGVKDSMNAARLSSPFGRQREARLGRRGRVERQRRGKPPDFRAMLEAVP